MSGSESVGTAPLLKDGDEVFADIRAVREVDGARDADSASEILAGTRVVHVDGGAIQIECDRFTVGTMDHEHSVGA